MVKKSKGINTGSTADLAFLCLSFFMMTSSMDTDSGIARRLPPPIPPNAKPPEIRERNVLPVLVNMHNQLRVKGENLDISELRAVTKEFLSNPTGNPHLSEQVEKDIPDLGKVMTTKGVISLQNDHGTSYEMYIKVQNELTAAVNEMRDALSKERFGVKFVDLKIERQKKAIQDAIPVPISEAEPKDIGGKK